MIAYLTGTVTALHERTLVITTTGVGYLVHVPRRMMEALTIGQEKALHIHTNVREDDISLYGFGTLEEWQFFRLLLTVSGVGPKSALEILNAPIGQVKSAIAQKESAWLTRIPGIGVKTAERIIVDLQGKIKLEVAEDISSGAESEDILQALIALGFTRVHVREQLKKIPPEITGEEAIIKYFLQHS